MTAQSKTESIFVSVVLTTYKRPVVLIRAVKSVLAQTYGDFEVIVVIDGTEPETRTALGSLGDPRVCIIETGESGPGPGPARNIGVAAAIGRWVALLDDDDEWLPTKLAEQVQVIQSDPAFFGIVTTQVIARTPSRDYVWPQRRIADGEDVSTYLIDRPTLLGRPGLVQTSSMLVPRALFSVIRFEDEAHEEWTFIIKACKLHGAVIRFVWKPLTVYHYDPNAASLSTRCSWELSYNWAVRRRSLLSPRAYSAFLLSKVARKAKQQGDLRGLFRIAVQGLFHGNVRPRHVLAFAAIALLPHDLGKRFVQRTYRAHTPQTAVLSSPAS